MPEHNEVVVTAVGDLMLGDSVKCVGFGVSSSFRKKGAQVLFNGVTELLVGDIVFGNLECVITDRDYNRFALSNAQMCAPPSIMNPLAACGFNVLCVANNHTMQYGAKVFQETCQLLKNHGVGVVGLRAAAEYTCQPYFHNVRGKRVGILAYSIEKDNYCRGETLYAQGSEAEITSDISKIRQKVDYLIVSMHWGNEFVQTRSEKQADLGRKIIDAGADLVLGHHPHVIQEIEIYKSKPIIYSLGNFVSDMMWDDSLKEALACKVSLSSAQIEITDVFKVEVRHDLTPRNFSVLTCDHYIDEQWACKPHVEKVYDHIVERKRVHHRNVSHLFLLKNFFRYNPFILIQLFLRSFKSAVLHH